MHGYIYIMFQENFKKNLNFTIHKVNKKLLLYQIIQNTE